MECHSDASLPFYRTGGSLSIATGYALSEDGVWYRHSWGMDPQSGRVIETTLHRIRYFGYVMSELEAGEFLWDNRPHGSLTPEGEKQILDFVVPLWLSGGRSRRRKRSA
jgi:hypothetical protein